MGWDNSDREIQQDKHRNRQLHAAVLVSLALHGVIFSIVYWSIDQRSQISAPNSPTAIRVNLLPAPTPLEQQEQPVERPERDEEQGELDELPVDVADSRIEEAEEIVQIDQAPAPLEPAIEVAELVEPQVDLPLLTENPVSPLDTEALSEVVRTPDTMALKQTVREVREQQRSNANSVLCTLEQRRNDLFDCAEPDEPDYSQALVNPVYLSFNPAPADNTSRRAMATVAGNQQRLREGIAASSLDGANSDYLLEELTQGLEVYSGTGNTRVERLTDQMLRNDPVYQQAKRVLNPR